MINIDFANPLDQVRLNVGDIDGEWLSDSTINSALVAFNDNINSASIALFEALCTYFATQADKQQVGEVQVHYTKLYERYKERLDNFKDTGGGIVPTEKAFMAFIIGGTSKSKKAAVYKNTDSFSMYDLPDWHNKHLGNATLEELIYERLDYAINNGY
jgi:hypothetical protein